MPKEQLTPEQMDNAAEAAREELGEIRLDATQEHYQDFDQSLTKLAGWWRKWYLLAGHKRLGRIILAVK